MRYRRLCALAFAVAISAPQSAPAAPPIAGAAAVLATVHRYANAFNRGDIKAEVAVCASPASIVDDFPPHSWQGQNAGADWAAALAETSKSAAFSDEIIALAQPYVVQLDGDTAYVVNPTLFTMKTHGKPTTEHGIWTFALRETPASWRIAGWAWAATH